MRKLLFLFLLLVFYKSGKCQDTVITPYEKSFLSFAEFLYANQEYERAANEYEKYFFLSKVKLDGDSIILRISDCFKLMNQYDKAINYLNKIETSSNLYFQAMYEKAKNNFLSSKYTSSIDDLCRIKMEETSKLNRLKILNYAILQKWDDVNAFNKDPNLEQKQLLNKIMLAKHEMNLKSPFVAGMMSAILPGSGKIYSNRWKDGIYSFITIAFSFIQAYQGYTAKGYNSLNFWLFGSISSFLYAGNIYGSYMAAKLNNLESERMFVERIRGYYEE